MPHLTPAIVEPKAEQIDNVVAAVKKFHLFGQGDGLYSGAHPGSFNYCTLQPCLGVLQAYPDAIPADKRPDWIEGAASLARHDKKEK